MERSAHMTEGPHGGQDSRNGNQDPPEDTTPAEGNIYDRKSVIEGGQGSAEGSVSAQGSTAGHVSSQGSAAGHVSGQGSTAGNASGQGSTAGNASGQASTAGNASGQAS